MKKALIALVALATMAGCSPRQDYAACKLDHGISIAELFGGGGGQLHLQKVELCMESKGWVFLPSNIESGGNCYHPSTQTYECFVYGFRGLIAREMPAG